MLGEIWPNGVGIILLGVAPAFDKFRSEQGFHKLKQRVGIPDVLSASTF
jgi:hypothetical protein